MTLLRRILREPARVARVSALYRFDCKSLVDGSGGSCESIICGLEQAGLGGLTAV